MIEQSCGNGYFIAPASNSEVSKNMLTSREQLDAAIQQSACEYKAGKENNQNLANNDTVREPSKPKRKVLAVERTAFEVLPESTRGRAKLEDVQNTLTILQTLMKKKKRKRQIVAGPTTVSIKDLDAAGAKVVGHTGACVLQCLRTLGFIKISKGEITMVPEKK